jgi:hypothetical protein
LRRCWPLRMSKKILIAAVPLARVGKNCGKSPVTGCATSGSPWDRRVPGVQLRDIEWTPAKAAPAAVSAEDPPAQEDGPWQWAAAFGRATGPLGAEDFVLQEDGKLRCPAGANLWLSEVRQENAFTQRAVYLAYQTDCQRCALPEQCLASGAKGDRARRLRAVRHLLPPPAPVPVERKPVLLAPIRWVDVAGRALRRTWTAHWRRQCVEILPLADTPPSLSPPLRPPRALRSHHRWSWHDRLACTAWSGPPKPRITLAGVAAFLPSNEDRRNWHHKQLFRSRVIFPLTRS